MITEQTKQYLRNYLKNKRVDGRKLDEYRELVVETGLIRTAEGSARVKLGKTEVIVGIKMGIGEPFSDKPEDGVLITSAEFSQIADPEFEWGPPGEEAIELARVIDRGIRESEAIELEKLCITAGEKVWMVFVDILVVNNDGNLIDTSGIASIAALLNTKIPSLNKDGEVDREKESKNKLPIVKKPIPVTIRKVKGNLLLDTTNREEEVTECNLTITTTDKGNVCAIQKSGEKTITREEFEKALKLSKKYGDIIRKKLK